jgi:hypothetical protein
MVSTAIGFRRPAPAVGARRGHFGLAGLSEAIGQIAGTCNTELP